MPKASSFKEIVTMDLKYFGSNYIFSIINSFSRKGHPEQKSGYHFNGNGKEFSNVNMDEFTPRLGITIRFGLMGATSQIMQAVTLPSRS